MVRETANTACTYGPLHLDYLVHPDGVRWGGLAAVFGIGLFFGIIYRRPGTSGFRRCCTESGR